MDEELKQAISELTGEYIPGSAAPKIKEPEQKPDSSKEPEQKPHISPKPKFRRPTYTFSSVLTVIGIVIVAVCAFFLLTREVSIQAQKNNIIELKSDIEKLYIERDYLLTRYNSSIDIAAIRERAAQYGMHEPTDDQIVNID